MNKEQIYEFIAKQRTSLISSVDENGYPATRALIQPVLIEGNSQVLKQNGFRIKRRKR